jgi:hypothetical protein
MAGRTRTNLTALIALLALVVACGGTAVAAGLAKDSVTSRSIKNNAVKSKDIKDGAVQSADLKDGTVQSADVKDGTIRSADVEDETLTGADIAESSLGVVPDATAVGGVRVTPVSVSIPSGASEVPVLSESGNTLRVDCVGSTSVLYSRGASGPPMVVTSGTLTDSLTPGESVSSNLADGHYTATVVLPGGGFVTAEFVGVYEANAEGANDCFYRGTVTRSP